MATHIAGFSLNNYGALYFFQNKNDFENAIAANPDFRAIIGNGGDYDALYPGVFAALQRKTPEDKLPEMEKIKMEYAQTGEYPVFPPCGS